ncbi:hypothetical protein ACJIZ3_013806 [Penstemon smallii]|uniref:Uncharacterized protein n=1 Tax=Penstemon smallii TaxID=265156 RepID=A0ABD3RHR1_9LAMI
MDRRTNFPSLATIIPSEFVIEMGEFLVGSESGKELPFLEIGVSEEVEKKNKRRTVQYTVVCQKCYYFLAPLPGTCNIYLPIFIFDFSFGWFLVSYSFSRSLHLYCIYDGIHRLHIAVHGNEEMNISWTGAFWRRRIIKPCIFLYIVFIFIYLRTSRSRNYTSLISSKHISFIEYTYNIKDLLGERLKKKRENFFLQQRALKMEHHFKLIY